MNQMLLFNTKRVMTVGWMEYSKLHQFSCFLYITCPTPQTRYVGVSVSGFKSHTISCNPERPEEASCCTVNDQYRVDHKFSSKNGEFDFWFPSPASQSRIFLRFECNMYVA